MSAMNQHAQPEIFVASVYLNQLNAACEVVATDDDHGRCYALRVPVTAAGLQSIGATETAFCELFQMARDNWPK